MKRLLLRVSEHDPGPRVPTHNSLDDATRSNGSAASPSAAAGPPGTPPPSSVPASDIASPRTAPC